MKREDARVPNPCGADWRAMSARGKARLCGACDTLVHDLSAMTETEARALLGAPRNGRLCIRYLHDETGEIWFRDRAPAALLPASRLTRRGAMAAAAVAVALLPALTEACGSAAPDVYRHYGDAGTEGRAESDARIASPTVGPPVEAGADADHEGQDEDASAAPDASAD